MIKYGVNPGELDINYQYVMAIGERMEMEDDNVKSYDIVLSTEAEVKDEQKVNLKNDRTMQSRDIIDHINPEEGDNVFEERKLCRSEASGMPLLLFPCGWR